MTAGLWTALAAAFAFAASLAGTAMVRRYAEKWLIDHPNERSSHVTPTPRGGGLALIAAFVCAAAVLAAAGVVDRRTALALLPGVALVAAVGWVDDHRALPAAPRAALHFIAAAWALAWLGGYPALRVGEGSAHLGAAGWLLGMLGIVWVTNLYNFMDGIDGLAGGEAVSAGVAGAVLLWLAGASGLAAVSVVLAAAAGGFLVWNWHPARIFMGDVGSGAVGYALAVLAIASENVRAVPTICWVLLTGVFVADATITFVRRLARRERVYAAHRSHAYQRATQAGRSHAWVTAAVLLINLALALIALAALLHPPLLLPALVAGAVLLIAIYLLVERAVPMGRTPGS